MEWEGVDGGHQGPFRTTSSSFSSPRASLLTGYISRVGFAGREDDVQDCRGGAHAGQGEEVRPDPSCTKKPTILLHGAQNLSYASSTKNREGLDVARRVLFVVTSPSFGAGCARTSPFALALPPEPLIPRSPLFFLLKPHNISHGARPMHIFGHSLAYQLAASSKQKMKRWLTTGPHLFLPPPSLSSTVSPANSPPLKPLPEEYQAPPQEVTVLPLLLPSSSKATVHPPLRDSSHRRSTVRPLVHLPSLASDLARLLSLLTGQPLSQSSPTVFMDRRLTLFESLLFGRFQSAAPAALVRFLLFFMLLVWAC